ncbi:hypothetical protein Nepgr_024853 [Nepenthes gracilis]|uniref:H(+)-exporting diphosphatase n=1 Tax=Nepenthes gracilis TaxID=150966 RepID=A0AAD3Y0H2_NEPGR|nr:hypothetical protein Nepgr_024853 [Nepenthes gracilis]
MPVGTPSLELTMWPTFPLALRKAKGDNFQFFSTGGPKGDHLFFLIVKLCYGKLILGSAYKRGFLSFGKHHILSHNFVDFLQQHSRAFDKTYDDLMRAFTECNQFCNLPFGLKSNSWLNSPDTALTPLTFPPSPVKDKIGEGNGGGITRGGRNDLKLGAKGSQYHGEDWGGLFESIPGYGIAGSSVALFGIVGGGIHLKVVDVDATLISRVKGNNPKDHPRNSTIIANNVGGNVGDVGTRFFVGVPEETIPVDENILVGRSVVEKSMLTGESLPILKKKGLGISAILVNWGSLLGEETTTTGSNSTGGRCLQIVEA